MLVTLEAKTGYGNTYPVKMESESTLKNLGKKRGREESNPTFNDSIMDKLDQIIKVTEVLQRNIVQNEDGLNKVRINDIKQRIRALDNSIKKILLMSSKEELMSYPEWRELAQWFT